MSNEVSGGPARCMSELLTPVKALGFVGPPQWHQYIVVAYGIAFPLGISLSLTSCLSVLKSITDCVDVGKSVYIHMRKTPHVDADGIFVGYLFKRK